MVSNISATVWTVDDDGTAQFTTIQAAVDTAQNGDTVFVFPGVYMENINLLNKTIWLIGSAKDSTIIEATTGGLLFGSNKCYVYNFTLEGNNSCEFGISLESNSTIKNNNISNFYYAGLKIPFGPTNPNSDLLIENNLITNNHYGIFFDVDYPGHPDSIKVIGNTIENNDYGIIYFPE